MTAKSPPPRIPLVLVALIPMLVRQGGRAQPCGGESL